jgi:archaemetzincin
MGYRKEEKLDVLWIVPFGVIQGDYLHKIAKKTAEQVPVECMVQPTLHIPKQAYDTARKKYNSTILLDQLKELEAPTQSILGVTEYDIFSPKWDYVFSESDMVLSIAVLSFLRLRQEFYGLKPDENRFYHRALSEMVHVVGHLFGFRHCSDPYCVMYNTPTLVDLDRKGHRFCARCQDILTP